MTKETVFITGGSGFIGKFVVSFCLKEKYNVQVLSRQKQNQANVEYIQGDLLNKGSWYEAANKANYVIHLAQPKIDQDSGMSDEEIRRFSDTKLHMDKNLLEALEGSTSLKRIIYVAGLNYFGPSNGELGDENSKFPHNVFGKMIEEYVAHILSHLQKLPLVIVFPGAVYGNGSWFVDDKHGMLSNIIKGRAVPIFDDKPKYMSVIHVEDAALAMIYLLTHGSAHEKYILVDTKPITTEEMMNSGRKYMQLPEIKPAHVPEWILKMFVSQTVMQFLKSDMKYSSKKLQDTGFQFKYPTIDVGMPAVLSQIGDAKYFQQKAEENQSVWSKLKSWF